LADLAIFKHGTRTATLCGGLSFAIAKELWIA